MVTIDWTTVIPLVIPIVAGGLRNLAGWLQNSLQDGKIQAYEWGQLGSTVLEVFVLSMAAMFGLNLNVGTAAGIGVLGSFALSAVKSAGAGKKVVAKKSAARKPVKKEVIPSEPATK